MAKIILAVSGGVDSMVMLDMICRAKNYSSGDIFSEIIVAHFDHGTRPSSALDAEFVERKAKEYGVEFQLGKGELGEGIDEATARAKRYEFLHSIDPFATIFTAHHLDDLVETVAINLVRGTGWRGLSVLDSPGIRRPFLETEMFYEPMDKVAIVEYAAKRKLEFREDPTNSSDEYLRNRIRHQMNNSPPKFEQKLEVYQLWRRQKQLKSEIDQLVVSLLPKKDTPWPRAWFKDLEPNSALELLRAGTLRAGIAATRPQLEDFRQAILSYAPGKYFNLPGDRLVKITKTDFTM